MMVKFEDFWLSNPDWYYIKDGARVIREDAPQEAKESYRIFIQQVHRTYKIQKRMAEELDTLFDTHENA